MRATNRRWTIIGIVTLLLLAVVPVTATLSSDTAEAAGAAPGDGTTSATAGASCWGIKQEHPGSEDGSYWLLTASMDRPAEFHCDMTTAGGGWVLVGRGRNGWTFNAAGQRSPANVRSPVDGPEAFAPAALGTATIAALTDHADISALPDGIRLERAISANGQTRQDYRVHPKMRAWSWNLPAGQLANKMVINGSTFNGSNTRDTSLAGYGETTNQLRNVTDNRRLFTLTAGNKGGNAGFGTSVGGGSNSSTNYLWTNGTEGNPLPFTRVWLRPQIANDDAGHAPIPAGGFAAETKPLDLKDRAEVAPWGVVGLNRDGEDVVVDPWYANVMTVDVFGDRVYVGGRFTGVQQGPNNAPVAQRSIAVFDLDGNWISSFRPEVDGRVWDMTMTDDGKLIIAGDFLSVDGLPNTGGLAALDPATGEVITSWRAHVTRPDTDRRAVVRSVEARGDWVYAAGRFTRLQGGDRAPIGVSSARSVRASDGAPGNWRPIVHASAVDLEASEDGSRMYMAGSFGAVNGDTNHRAHAITRIDDGAPVPGMGPFQPAAGSDTRDYQQAVGEHDGNPLVGGSQHNLHKYNRDRSQLLDSHITRQGGDFQAIEVIDGDVYASCHCANWNYSGTNSWSGPTNFRSVDPINLVGRWDAETFEYDTTWLAGGTRGLRNEGVWAISPDSRDCLWVGGDLTRRSFSGNATTDFAGGFLRYCPTDSSPPTAPTNLSANVDGDAVALSWGAATDNSGSVSYDIYRNDRVIATVSGTTYRDAEVQGSDAQRYTVRAADARGNRSASPAPVAVDGPAPRIDTPIEFGSTWRYRDDGADLGTDWRRFDHDDSSWASGPAVLGWNGNEATTIGPNRPITSYFRGDFDLGDPSQVKLLDLQLLVTQGTVVYVNGIEVGRYNMPSGAITSTTVASEWVGGAENLRRKQFQVPASLLRAGRNNVAVEVHGWRDKSGLLLFDLEATAVGATADQTPPTAPVLEAAGTGATAELSWTPSTDEGSLAGYLVERDGEPRAVVGPRATTYTDSGLDPGASHVYVVTAFDGAGNRAPSNSVEVGTDADARLLAFGSSWRWSYEAEAPAGDWRADDFDDAGWVEGDGAFGFGDMRATTFISEDPAPRPITSYYRTEVELDPADQETVSLDLISDAGAVVHVNGAEVARFNMPEGEIGHNTWALTRRPAAERGEPVRFELPTSALRPGANTVAVELHLGWRSQPSALFDLELSASP
ncbi:hypothetical protein BH23ACT2_BH23ACT2_19470 [soil metagenome]